MTYFNKFEWHRYSQNSNFIPVGVSNSIAPYIDNNMIKSLIILNAIRCGKMYVIEMSIMPIDNKQFMNKDIGFIDINDGVYNGSIIRNTDTTASTYTKNIDPYSNSFLVSMYKKNEESIQNRLWIVGL